MLTFPPDTGQVVREDDLAGSCHIELCHLRVAAPLSLLGRWAVGPLSGLYFHLGHGAGGGAPSACICELAACEQDLSRKLPQPEIITLLLFYRPVVARTFVGVWGRS